MSLNRLSGGNSFVEFILIIVIALGLAFGIQAFIVKPYKIPSLSMYPTLKEGQRVLVDRLGNDFDNPHIGEIVVFHPPNGATGDTPICGAPQVSGEVCPTPYGGEASINFIKRIVAGPGDTIAIQNGYVILNGVRQKEPFAQPCGQQPGSPCNFPKAFKVPAGYWFMMGDNRGNSDDSRFWGPVPRKWIIGGAFFTYWPPDRIGTL